jgi:hypothetical protein
MVVIRVGVPSPPGLIPDASCTRRTTWRDSGTKHRLPVLGRFALLAGSSSQGLAFHVAHPAALICDGSHKRVWRAPPAPLGVGSLVG